MMIAQMMLDKSKGWRMSQQLSRSQSVLQSEQLQQSSDDTKRVLPQWLRGSERYTPLPDKSSFVQRNLEHLGGVLEQIGTALPISGSIFDRALCSVSPAMRVIGVPTAIVCVNITRNMMFSYIMLALVLSAMASRSGRLIQAILKPTVEVCVLSVIVALPAVFIGQYSAPIRLVVKAFISVSLVIALARTVPWNRLIAGLRGIGMPDSVIYVCDVTIQFIDILGRSMLQLLDALQLRSVGRDTRKLMSAGRLMGVLFLRANTQARHMAEAMVCRGFHGRYRVRREPLLTVPNIVYALCIVAMVMLAIYLG